MEIKIGSRKSDLAKLQSYKVGNAIKCAFPNIRIKYIFKATNVDKDLSAKINTGDGVFTKELQKDLANGEFDICVHSWKDLPAEEYSKTEVFATLKREDPHDVLLIKKFHMKKIMEDSKITVFTSSPRRCYYLPEFISGALPSISSVNIEPIRGNIQTRVKKLIDSENVDGLMIAKAALDRMLATNYQEFQDTREFLKQALTQLNFMVLPLSYFPSAPAQGALAIEIAKGRQDLKDILKNINHAETFSSVIKEREILRQHGGGCQHNLGATFINKPYGTICSVKGVEDDGTKIDEYNFTPLKTLPHDIIPCSQALIIVDERNAENVVLNENANYFISRSNAFPANIKSENMLLSTAGWQSWKKLAKQGHFISVSSDSLGIHNSVNLEYLCGKQPEFIKLTHADAPKDDKMESLSTYKAIYKTTDIKENEIEGNFFFWDSGSAFKTAIAKYPSLKNMYHACGAGKTYDIILEVLRDSEKIFIFPNKKQWSLACQSMMNYLNEQKK